MTLFQAFPPLGLRIEAGPLVLRPVTDEAMPELFDVVLAGIHEPALMPFSTPWTDASATELPLAFAQFHWGRRATWSRDAWDLELAVEYQGRLVGCQGFMTSDFLVTRTGETGSWLGRAHQGKGIGTLMRQAICAFAFDYLTTERITSGSFVDNPASAAVSRKVGYQPNGKSRATRRPGEFQELQSWLLTPETFVRGPEIRVEGVAEFRTFIGLG